MGHGSGHVRHSRDSGGAGGGSPPVHGGASLDVREEYHDNVRLAEEKTKTSDTLTGITVGAHAEAKRLRLDAGARYEGEAVYYGKSDHPDQYYHRWSGTATYALIRERLFAEAGAERRQVPRDTREPALFDNLVDTDHWWAGARYTQPLGSWLSFGANYRYGGQRFEDAAEANNRYQNADASLTAMVSRYASLSAFYSWTETDVRDGVDITRRQTGATLGIRAIPKVTVSATYGYNWIETSEGFEQEGPFFALGLGAGRIVGDRPEHVSVVWVPARVFRLGDRDAVHDAGGNDDLRRDCRRAGPDGDGGRDAHPPVGGGDGLPERGLEPDRIPRNGSNGQGLDFPGRRVLGPDAPNRIARGSGEDNRRVRGRGPDRPVLESLRQSLLQAPPLAYGGFVREPEPAGLFGRGEDYIGNVLGARLTAVY